jgi:hypothetical protein
MDVTRPNGGRERAMVASLKSSGNEKYGRKFPSGFRLFYNKMTGGICRNVANFFNAMNGKINLLSE